MTVQAVGNRPTLKRYRDDRQESDFKGRKVSLKSEKSSSRIKRKALESLGVLELGSLAVHNTRYGKCDFMLCDVIDKKINSCSVKNLKNRQLYELISYYFFCNRSNFLICNSIFENINRCSLCLIYYEFKELLVIAFALAQGNLEVAAVWKDIGERIKCDPEVWNELTLNEKQQLIYFGTKYNKFEEEVWKIIEDKIEGDQSLLLLRYGQLFSS